MNVNIDINAPCHSTPHSIGDQHSNVYVYNSSINISSVKKTLPDLFNIPLPKLNIVIMAVGTRGDIQPFILLGKRLRDDGHRVRLATHECFRPLITSPKIGLEFYPLGGDPVKLSEYMVKSQGWLLPANPELIMETPAYLAMLSEVLFSTWGACTAEDPFLGIPSEVDDNDQVDGAVSNNGTLGEFLNPRSHRDHEHLHVLLGTISYRIFPSPIISAGRTIQVGSDCTHGKRGRGQPGMLGEKEV